MKMVEVIVDLSKVDKFGPKMPEIRKVGLKNIALDMTRTVDKLSPVDEGLLHKWFVAELSEDHATIKSPAKYVGPVNYGHSQRVGRFIPGSWNGDKFKYNPDSKTGMVLKQPFVEGKHFVEQSFEQLQPRVPGYFLKALEEVQG
jgi:hypothetical protein